MGFWRNWIGYPGQRHAVLHTAKTVDPLDFDAVGEKEPNIDIEIRRQDEVGFNGCKETKMDKGLDFLVWVVGTQFTFWTMWAILIAWAVIGIVFNAPNTWQVVMQDAQSIQTYIWDTLLMRQQLMQSFEQNLIWAEFSSRVATYRRLLSSPEYIGSEKLESTEKLESGETKEQRYLSNIDYAESSVVDLPVEGWFDKTSSFLNEAIGSLPAVIIYWAGIFVWIGCGALESSTGNSPPFTGVTTGSNPERGTFTNTWQMYINTATAVVLLITSVFLQNVRERHDQYVKKTLDEVMHLDYSIEARIRAVKKDMEPNLETALVPDKRTIAVHAIDWYADMIGTGIGVIIAIFVIVVWLLIGHPMNWSDNWWLIIGTYTGLIGFIDGFVLRNVYMRMVNQDESTYARCKEEDKVLFSELGLVFPEEPEVPPATLSYKISVWVNDVCSTTWAVGVSLLIVLGLIICASALRWSEMGQLLCNTPTMIIEGFFLIILMQAHNWADEDVRKEVHSLFVRRKILFQYVDQL
ncbi:hypothetical protein LJB42_004453 [Komagataella kurtzmanii]|nr:hypothetical protein LJB42_004453 [Komagataella kurtzmanii]